VGEVEPTVAVEARVEPPLAAISAPPNGAPVIAVTLAPVVEPPPAEHAEPLLLASARPTRLTVKVRTGSEPRFDVSLKNGDNGSLQWQLSGETIARGQSIVLRKEITGTPGHKHLEVLAAREGSLVRLRSWDVEIEASPLGFAALEPSNRTVERTSGTLVRFRAPVSLAGTQKPAFLWQVDGRPVRGVEGPAFDFQAQSAGEYVVQVRATAPWGESIVNIWTLSIRPPIVPTRDLKEEYR
jgi:hypothetical protein